MSKTTDVEPRAPSLVFVVVLRASREADADGILAPVVVDRGLFRIFADCSPLQTVLKIFGQVGQPFHGIWGLSGTGRGALHRANLSRLTGTRFVNLQITPVCKPFQCFCDRLDNQFVVFGLGRNGGGGHQCIIQTGHCIMQTCRG